MNRSLLMGVEASRSPPPILFVGFTSLCFFVEKVGGCFVGVVCFGGR